MQRKKVSLCVSMRWFCTYSVDKIVRKALDGKSSR
jgi:hypothetical protein